MSQIPIKFRVVQVIYQNKEVSDREIFEILKNEYPLDRSVTEKGIENYLLSLRAVGLIELTDVFSDSNGKLKIFYKITDYGANRMKYIPMHLTA